MWKLAFLLFILFAFSCNEKINKSEKTDQALSFLDSIKSKSRRADILNFVNFATSKISILAKTFTTISEIDSLFSIFGEQMADTSCQFFANNYPVGHIAFYKDTGRVETLLSLYFSLNDSCYGFTTRTDKSSPRYSMTAHGKQYLETLQNLIKPEVNKSR